MKLKYAASALLIIVIASVSAVCIFRGHLGRDTNIVAGPQESLAYDSIQEEEGSQPGEDSMRGTASIGATVTEISLREYQRLLADSCNRPLAAAPEKVRRNADSVTIFMHNSTISLLNLPYGDLASDFCIEWGYDGYDSARGLHFFSYTGYEAWGYYIADDATGRISQYLANEIPVFCAASDLFATMYENPYQGEVFLYIYKLLPGGQIVLIAACDRDTSRTHSLDLRKPVWIGANSLAALRAEPDTAAPEGFVQIDIDPAALGQSTPEPAPEWTYQDANRLVRTIKQRTPPN